MYWAKKLDVWEQDELETEVKKRLEIYHQMKEAACSVAEDLVRMRGGADPDLEDAEVSIEEGFEGEIVEVSWWENGPCGGEDQTETFPIEYLWDFDWRAKKQKHDMDVQLERLKMIEEEKKRKTRKQKEDRRVKFEKRKKENGE